VEEEDRREIELETWMTVTRGDLSEGEELISSRDQPNGRECKQIAANPATVSRQRGSYIKRVAVQRLGQCCTVVGQQCIDIG